MRNDFVKIKRQTNQSSVFYHHRQNKLTFALIVQYYFGQNHKFMFQKSFAAVSLILLLTIFSSAQYVPSNDENSLKMNEKIKSDEKKKKKIPNEMPVNAFDLSFFLPPEKDAWTLSLTSSGGFSGVTRFIVAVNSHGNYLCANEKFRNRLLEKPILDEIFDFVETEDFSKFSRIDQPEIKYCMDCSYTTINLQTRNGFVSRPMTNYANEAAVIKQIYDRLSNLEECK